MDFYITKEEIVSSLNTTLGVVEKRQTLPILANVLFEVDESTLRLTATDLESEISTISTISNFKSGAKQQPQQKNLASFVGCLKMEMKFIFFLMATI
jgi:DNA polymerase-3 subunit beta